MDGGIQLTQDMMLVLIVLSATIGMFVSELVRVDIAAILVMVAIGLLDPAVLGQGLGTEALRLIAAHGFGTMKLHRLALRVLDFNERAIAAYGKVGFVIEGRERQTALIDGQWHDDVMMGMLAHEFDWACL